MQLGVSVIICCFNSAARLPETFKNLAMQDVPAAVSWEIIVIDNASTDDTGNYALTEWPKLNVHGINLSVLNQPIPGKNYAYKLGVEHAQYEYILTCDDDNLLHANYVADVFRIMQSDEKIGVLGGRGIFCPEQPERKGIEAYAQSYVNGSQQWAGTEHWVYGAGSTCRKSIMMEFYAKGWYQFTSGRTGSKLICGEDIEICFMFFLHGYKIVADDSLTFDHFVPLKRQNLGYLLNLKYWVSYSYVLLNNYLMAMDDDKRRVQQKLNDWFIASLKGITRLSIKIIRQKLLTLKSPGFDQQLSMKAYLGTLQSIRQNRSKIIKHYKELGDVLKAERQGTSFHNEFQNNSR